MVLNKQKKKEFEVVARPLIKFLNDNCHPHVMVVVNSTEAEMFEGFCQFMTEDYLKD